MDWRGLIRISRDFDLLGIETPSIHMDWGRTEQALRVCLVDERRGMNGSILIFFYVWLPWRRAECY
jgi:hypothetical protein